MYKLKENYREKSKGTITQKFKDYQKRAYEMIQKKIFLIM